MQLHQRLECLSGCQKAAFSRHVSCHVTHRQPGQAAQQQLAPSIMPVATLQRQQQLQQRQHSTITRAAPRPAALSLSFLTENPIGKLLSGLVGTPLFVAMEVVALLVILGLTDAAYSGDWSRIGAITKDAELLLQKVTIIAWALHGLCGLWAANIASSKGRSPGAAVVKGVLFGSLHVFEELVLPPAGSQAAAANNPVRRRRL